MAATASGRVSSPTRTLRWRIEPGPLGGLGTPDDLAVEQPAHDDPEEAVQESKEHERHHQAGHRGNGVGGSHDAVDDPRLATHFGYDPAGLDRDEPHRSRK